MDDKYKLTLSENDIYILFDQLNMEYEKGVNHKGWFKCRCLNPSHIDNSPSCSVNVYNYKVKCFSCKYDTNLTSAISKLLNLSYSEAFDFINKNLNLNQNSNSNFRLQKQRSIISKDNNSNAVKENSKKYITTDLISENFIYTKERGFTKEFISQFNIKHCLSDIYSDYMMIPVIDEEYDVNTFEFRKLKQKEILIKENIDDWDEYKSFYKLKYIKRKGVFSETLNEFISNPNIIYLMKPKTLYIKNTNIQNTIFNRHNLNCNEILTLSEGFASLPKMMKVLGKNCSCVFGTELTENQIDILKKFKEINLISDNDLASYIYIDKLSNYHNNINVYDSYLDDKQDNFEYELKNSKLLKSKEFLLKRLK